MRRVVEASWPSGPRTATAFGRSTGTFAPKGMPQPDGVNTSAWLSALRQWPDTAGVSLGRAEPRTLSTGSEKVRCSGVEGVILLPGAGLLIATAVLACGN